MDQRIVDLYDEYTHTLLARRAFLERLAKLTGSMAAALTLVPLLENNRARAAIVPAEDPRLESVRTSYPGATGDIQAFVSRPRESKRLPAVIVIHENRGLNAHIEDVARRVALAGFVAMAPDLLSPQGGTPADEDAARNLIRELDAEATVRNLVAAVHHLESDDHGNGKVGALGFCWGGGMAAELAAAAPDLDAAVVYYGRQPDPARVESIQAPLLLHYAGLDTRINAGIPAFEAVLKQAKKKYTLHVYEGVNHGFNNDTSEARYDKPAAELAWTRTITFLTENLR